MKRFLLSLITTAMGTLAIAQYAPQAQVAGSTAIASGGSLWKGWATGCRVYRGFQDVAQPLLGPVSAGDSSQAIGPSDKMIVSLGDSGVAVLTFAQPIINGPGPDFAVFENGFADPVDPEQAYMELAFVEVSSDGVSFFRFPATSHTQDTQQVAGTGEYMNARKVNNLAGKYISGYGTPFDLQEMTGIAGLDVNNITHVRIVDVIGDLSVHQSLDAGGHVINDPYPTPFPTGGFDLDAVGVLNQQGSSGVAGMENPWALKAGPNPVSDVLQVNIGRPHAPLYIALYDISGKLLQSTMVAGDNYSFSFKNLPSGLYLLTAGESQAIQWSERIVKR